MIHDIDYKDEFNFHAVALIFGQNSPKISSFAIYKFDVMKKHTEFKFMEISGLTPENVSDVYRRLVIHKHQSFVTNNCQMSSGVCRTITFLEDTHKISVKDDLFTDIEYDYFLGNWDATVKNKIRTLGILIRSIQAGQMYEIPILMNEYPNITGVLLKHPDIWIKNES